MKLRRANELLVYFVSWDCAMIAIKKIAMAERAVFFIFVLLPLFDYAKNIPNPLPDF
jgi:hypothetical protein